MQVVAYEHDANANRRELRSKANGLLAYYDKNTNRTFDAKNRNAGAGDQTGQVHPEGVMKWTASIRFCAAPQTRRVRLFAPLHYGR